MPEHLPQRTAQLNLLHDFGGNGPILHLAHANGFAPGTYQVLAEALTDHYHVIGLPARPLWPHSRPESAPTWHILAEDLVQGLLDLDLHHVVGIGHSLGGVTTLWAAIRRPELFRGVILIDPVILPPLWLCLLRLLRGLGFGRHQPFVKGALHRRRSWPSYQACFRHLREKPLFARWPDAVLHDYVQSGTRPQADGGLELAYPPEWEAQIFATTPLDIWRDVPHLHTAALIVRGERSTTFPPASLARLVRQLPQVDSVTIRGAGHLVPMEQPARTSRAILSFLGEG